jgi:hypothetical protein
MDGSDTYRKEMDLDGEFLKEIQTFYQKEMAKILLKAFFPLIRPIKKNYILHIE